MNANSRPKEPSPSLDERAGRDASKPRTPSPDDGTNETRPEPDPQAAPLADGDPKYVPRSPYTAGNT